MNHQPIIRSLLLLISSISWTTVYIAAIRIGYRDRTYAVPAISIALNFAWESIYAVWGFWTSEGIRVWIRLIWAALDLGIIVTFLTFGRREFPAYITRDIFIACSVLMFAIAFVTQMGFIAEFGPPSANAYTAFLQNALMSGLYIGMLMSRGTARGQNMTIAVCKCIGTIAPSIDTALFSKSPLVVVLGCICVVLDVIYVVYLHSINKSHKLYGNPEEECTPGSEYGA